LHTKAPAAGQRGMQKDTAFQAGGFQYIG
jgi:hypothetical protein